MYSGFAFCELWFTNLVALLRFMQVCVWKRVVEINEDLGLRIASLSVFSGKNIKSLLYCLYRFNEPNFHKRIGASVVLLWKSILNIDWGIPNKQLV